MRCIFSESIHVNLNVCWQVQRCVNEMMYGLIRTLQVYLNFSKDKRKHNSLTTSLWILSSWNSIVNNLQHLYFILSRRGRGIGWMRLLFFFGKTYFYDESFGYYDFCHLADDLKVLFVIFWCHCSYIFTVTDSYFNIIHTLCIQEQ